MSIATKLRHIQDVTKSLVCVGLDFDATKVPEVFMRKFLPASGPYNNLGLICEFNKAIIRATAPFCCAYKPNLAFYENAGDTGTEALKKTVEFIKKEFPEHLVILDGKRGDIGNTAAQYAEALKKLGADTVTVNPYLGPDTLVPFLETGLGIIVLCVTTNSGNKYFQYATVKMDDGTERPMYLHVADTITNYEFQKDPLDYQGSVGLVTGATHPEELGEVRKLVGDDILLLIPGIGKQEGDLEATIRNNGRGLAVVNVSRSCIYASTGEDFAEAAGQEAKKLRDAINKIRSEME